MVKCLRFCCLFLLFAAPAPAPAESAVKTVRVLFIGNSLTYFNDLPSMFEDFAEAAYPNVDVVTDLEAPSGESLKGHWEKGTALQKLQGARWDYVVLQEHGALPAGFFKVDGVVRHERPDEFFDYGERFAGAASAAKAKPVLYQTYASPDALPYMDYAYMTLGRKTGALVAPLARVWHKVRSPKLYHADGMHPSAHGSYLAAVTIAATLFGDPPPMDAIERPASISDGEAREFLAALRSVREELAPGGGYANLPAPDFAARPSLASSLPIGEGTWSAKDNGLELSLGSRLTLSFDAGAPKIEMVDFTLNGAFPLPVSNVAMIGQVIQFDTTSQNRNYHVQLARRGDGVEMLVEHLRGTSSAFTHVDYGRQTASDHFEFLSRHFQEIAGKTTQESFESAVLRYYEELSGRLGAEQLSRILMGQTPLSDQWWAIMTGWEYKRRNQHDAAVRFLTFATHRFPQSCEAFQNLSEGLEAAGRIEEAYNAIFRAEALVTREIHPTMVARIKEAKARLEKLRAAPPAGA